MTTKRIERELAFLRYLDALETGDIEAVSAFLEQAEDDAILEQMMLDYHSETEAQIADPKPQVITPFKLKREHTQGWLGRVGSGLVAALLMAMVGLSGLFIGLNAANPPSEPVSDANFIPEMRDGRCFGIVASDDNTISPMGSITNTVSAIGVNNPFVVHHINTYMAATFEGYDIVLRQSDVAFVGDCEDAENINVYPQHYRGTFCNVQLDESALFGIESDFTAPNGAAIEYEYGQPVVIDSGVGGNVRVQSRSERGQFSASIDSDNVILEGDCSNLPLLYVPQSNDDVNACQAQIADGSNIVTLQSGTDLNEDVRIALNNPMTLFLSTDSEPIHYEVLYDGVRASVQTDSITLSDGCEEGAVVQVYPDNDPSLSCTVNIDRLQFPIRAMTHNADMFINATIGYDIIVLEAPVDGVYQIVSDEFEGGIPEEYVSLSGECDNFPLLYVPPRNREVLYTNNPYDYSESNNDGIVEVSSFVVVEQQLEKGAMFYIPAIEQYWLALERGDGVPYWHLVEGARVEGLTSMFIDEAPEGLFALDERFEYVWSLMNDHPIQRYQLGWATAEAVTHVADYEFIESGNFSHRHHLMSYTGDVYGFFQTSEEWHIITDGE